MATSSQLNTSIQRIERIMEEHVARFIAGQLDIGAFQREFEAEITIAHFLAVRVIYGSNNYPSELASLARRKAREDITFFQRWLSELQGQDVDESDFARLAARARLYARSIGETAERASLAIQGVPELPFYPKQDTVCRRNCRCSWEIRRTGTFRALGRVFNRGNFDCFWRLAAVEHCPTCQARARAANPLQVRRGEIVNPERYRRSVLYA